MKILPTPQISFMFDDACNQECENNLVNRGSYFIES